MPDNGNSVLWQVLQQRHAKVEAERDQLYSKFEASIYSVQQKTGVRNLLLEKKLSALGGVLEHKEAQLAEVMAASNLDPASLAQLNTVSAILPRLHHMTPSSPECSPVLSAYPAHCERSAFASFGAVKTQQAQQSAEIMAFDLDPGSLAQLNTVSANFPLL